LCTPGTEQGQDPRYALLCPVASVSPSSAAWCPCRWCRRPDGSLYVVEIVKAGVFDLFSGGDTTGALIRVKGGVRTELIAGQLHAPGDVAISRNGTIYVSNLSVSPDGGQVLAIH
jgi:hypothetical protein